MADHPAPTPVAPPSVMGGARVPHSLERTRVISAWQFLTPMLVVLALVAGWPLLRTIAFSFTNANLTDVSQYKWIGFTNYLYHVDGEWGGLLVDGHWWNSVKNTLWFSVISIAIETVFGFVVALVLNGDFKGRGLVRAAVLVPWAIPTIVSAKMWSWMLHDQFGVINDMLLRAHIVSNPIAWTANADTSLWAVVMVDVWKTTPFMALLILAGLQMIPADVYEAAKIDGIHPLRVFWRVTLPLVRPALMVAIIFRALDALRIFDLIYVLTSNSQQTASMSVFAHQQLVDFQDVGVGSAASTLLFLVIALVTILAIRVGQVKLNGEDQR